jgi:hypothetical protein
MTTTNEAQFANKVRHLLNQGMRVDAVTAERLRAARERALLAGKAERVPVLAWADNVLGSVGGLGGLSLRVLLPIALIALCVAATHTWQQSQRLAEIEEIDALLLTDDLPIDAYLDRGFDAWLKKSSAR